MPSIADDAARMAADVPGAVTARWSGFTACGPLSIEDREATDTSGLLIRERVTVLRVATQELPNIQRGATLVVTDDEGVVTSHRVREVQLADDGRVKDVLLA